MTTKADQQAAERLLKAAVRRAVEILRGPVRILCQSYPAGYESLRHAVDQSRTALVIDPEDAEQVERLARARQRAWEGPEPHTQVSAMQAALREFADPKCGASLTLGKDGALYRCTEPEGHVGPHADGPCVWTAAS